MLKWIILILLIVGSIWIYFNVDFSEVNNQAEKTIKQEKTLKIFFESDKQGKEQLDKTIKENF